MEKLFNCKLKNVIIAFEKNARFNSLFTHCRTVTEQTKWGRCYILSTGVHTLT